MNTYTKLVIFLLLSTPLWSQIQFEAKNEIFNGEIFNSGVAMCVTDLNNDFLDDIVHLDQGRVLYARLQAEKGNFRYFERVGGTGGERQWCAIGADIDNDGQVEIITAGAYDDVNLFDPTPDFSDFDRKFIDLPPFFAQAANSVDINNDGWLDLFFCNDVGPNRIALNNGDGTFRDSSDLIDWTTTPDSDMSGNYGSVWTDYDLDGDIDLHIAKCSQGVDNPNDGRRLNVLFENDGNGNFVNVAPQRGLDIGAQSWTGDFGDVDNDGDLDALITNHYDSTQLMINDSLIFTNKASDWNLDVPGFPIQGLFADFDNNGFQDIMIAGSDHALFFNNGNGKFEKADDLFDDNQIESIAIGDLNDDGFLDLYAGYANIFNSPSNRPDQMWINQANDNNWIKLKLRGIQNNYQGIGATVFIYSALGMQVRENPAAEGYGITNSSTIHFGLGTDLQIDSVIVNWPDGQRQVLTGMQINTSYLITEGCGYTRPETIKADDGVSLCQSDSLPLKSLSGNIVNWNTGENEASIFAKSTGHFHYQYLDTAGCGNYIYSLPVYVVENILSNPKLEISGLHKLCEGDSLVLKANQQANYLWNTGDTTPSILVSGEGIYLFQTLDDCGLLPSDTADILIASSTPDSVSGDSLTEPGIATLYASGDSIIWLENPDDLDVVGSGNTFQTPFIDTSHTYYAVGILYEESIPTRGGEEEHGGFTFFNSNSLNGELIFDCLKPSILRGFTVFADDPAPRSFIIKDQNGQAIWRDTVEITEGPNRVSTNLFINPGEDYRLTTDSMFNLSIQGFVSPRLYRNEFVTNYPYEISDNLVLQRSTFGTDYYYYFYDIEVSDEQMICYSNPVEVQAVVREPSPTRGLEHLIDLRIFPNPTTDALNIVVNGAEIQYLTVYNQLGSSVLQSESTINSTNARLSIQDLNSGVYLLKIDTDLGSVTRKVTVNKFR